MVEMLPERVGSPYGASRADSWERNGGASSPPVPTRDADRVLLHSQRADLASVQRLPIVPAMAPCWRTRTPERSGIRVNRRSIWRGWRAETRTYPVTALWHLTRRAERRATTRFEGIGEARRGMNRRAYARYPERCLWSPGAERASLRTLTGQSLETVRVRRLAPVCETAYAISGL